MCAMNQSRDSSKTAPNAATQAYAREFGQTAIKVNSVCPGHCATDMSGNTGERSAAEAAEIVARAALLPPDGPTGELFGEHGRFPW